METNNNNNDHHYFSHIIIKCYDLGHLSTHATKLEQNHLMGLFLLIKFQNMGHLEYAFFLHSNLEVI